MEQRRGSRRRRRKEGGRRKEEEEEQTDKIREPLTEVREKEISRFDFTCILY